MPALRTKTKPHLALIAGHPGRTGGMEKFCRFLVTTLLERNWRVTVGLSGENIYDDPGLNRPGDIDVQQVDWVDDDCAGDREYYWRRIVERRRWFRRVRPTVALFVQSFNTPFRASVVGAFLSGIPTVMTHRTMAWPVEESPRGRYAFGLVPGLGLHRRRVVAKTRLVSMLADRVVFNSEAVRRGYEKLYGYASGKTCVIANSVDSISVEAVDTQRDHRADGVTVGYVGRLGPEKRLDLLIRAVAEISSRHAVKLVIYGRGPAQETLTKLAAELGVSDRIEWCGVTDDVRAAYRRCDIVALCSRRESSSNMILEAMSAGKAVIVSSVGGLPELVEHGRCGLCVPPLEYAPLAEALARLIENKSLRDRLGERARQMVAVKHAPAMIADQWAGLLEEVAYRNRAGKKRVSVSGEKMLHRASSLPISGAVNP